MVFLTVTLNTALDVTYPVDRLQPGVTHRTGPPRVRAGGKGVNVARVLRALGEDVLVAGFAGGTAGTAFRADLAAAGLPAELVPVAGETRRTVTVLEESTGEATLFNEPGPQINEAEWREMLDCFRTLAATAKVVVLSGSLPPGVPPDAYAQLIAASAAPVLLDAGGPALIAGIKAAPHAVKPNAAELTAATGRRAGVRAGADALRGLGARNVIVSDGAAGMSAVTEHGAWQAVPPQTVRGNPTGAGDAAAAALARGIAVGTRWPELLADAVALSAAAVAAPVAGAVDLEAYVRFRPLVRPFAL